MNKISLSKQLIIFLLFFIFSCKPREAIVYYQNIDGLATAEQSSSYEIRIQPDDVLVIIVSAEDAESAIPFNLTVASIPSVAGLNNIGGQLSIQNYLVDASGEITFPVLGKLKIGGLDRSELQDLLESRISKYVKNPIVNIRRINFKISVQGEVNAPGTYAVNSDRVTLVEAISMAKDLTIYGKRDNILLIRDVNGKKTFNRIDITKADFINSPFYYLAQNDVVYVEPNKVRINGAAIGTNTSVMISVTSILITLITLIYK